MKKRSEGRMIRKDISNSKKIAQLSPEALSLFCMLIPHLDSYGKCNGSPYYIKGEVVPRIDWLTVDKIEHCLAEITKHTNVKWFIVDGREWIHNINFTEHQVLRSDRLGQDKLPDFPGGLPEESGSAPGVIQEDSTPEVEVEVEVEDKIKDKGSKSKKGNFHPVCHELLDFTLKKILNNHKGLGFTSDEARSFLPEFEKLIRIDGRKPGLIKKVITWVTSQTDKKDGFCWADQFMSPKKLRNKDKTGVKYFDKWLSMMLSEEQEKKPPEKQITVKVIRVDGKEAITQIPESHLEGYVEAGQIIYDQVNEEYIIDERNKASPEPEEVQESIGQSLGGS